MSCLSFPYFVFSFVFFQNYKVIEKGRLILFTTSMRIVRDTYEKCMRLKNILQTHMVQYEELDVFMSRENQRDLLERLGTSKIEVPQVFADGKLLGVSAENNLDTLFFFANTVIVF